MTLRKPYPILVIDDEPEFYHAFFYNKQELFSPIYCKTFSSAKRALETHKFYVILMDLAISNARDFREGIEVLPDIINIAPTTPIIPCSWNNDIKDYETTQSLLTHNFGFLRKATLINPIDHKRWADCIEKAADAYPLKVKKIPPIIESDIHKGIKRKFNQIKETPPYPVLLEGETGIGKKFIARHYGLNISSTNNKNIPIIDLSKTTPNKLVTSIKGLEGNTYLYIAGIDFINSDMQLALLTTFAKRLYVNFARWIIFSEENLGIKSNKGQFNRQLYDEYLRYFTILIPPLRERMSELTNCLDCFLKDTRVCSQNSPFFNKATDEAFEDDSLKLLKDYNWPGNFRELREVVRLASSRAEEENAKKIKPEHLGKRFHTKQIRKNESHFDYEFLEHLQEALNEAHGNEEEVLKRLKMKRFDEVKIPVERIYAEHPHWFALNTFATIRRVFRL
ncbi:MAG TPA: hypothetical protein PKA00_07925 [Saprospiraceae bacterium]|nr:hypothetical protein [Saprospiraceae bacterium]HMQ82820.1 hypothetical protein [Saprospiraceae bacterium]